MKQFIRDKKKMLVVVAVIAVFFVVILVVTLAQQPSIENYCRVYKEERARLSSLSDGDYPSGVFDKTLIDAGEFTTSFEKMEKVAPEEIRPDTATLKEVYQKISDDPSQAISAGLSGATAEDNVEAWVNHMCGTE